MHNDHDDATQVHVSFTFAEVTQLCTSYLVITTLWLTILFISSVYFRKSFPYTNILGFFLLTLVSWSHQGQTPSFQDI